MLGGAPALGGSARTSRRCCPALRRPVAHPTSLARLSRVAAAAVAALDCCAHPPLIWCLNHYCHQVSGSFEAFQKDNPAQKVVIDARVRASGWVRGGSREPAGAWTRAPAHAWVGAQAG